MTQTELAAAVGCSQSGISQFENGDKTILSRDLIEKMAGVLGIEAAFADASLPDDISCEVQDVLAFCPNYECPESYSIAIKETLNN